MINVFSSTVDRPAPSRTSEVPAPANDDPGNDIEDGTPGYDTNTSDLVPILPRSPVKVYCILIQPVSLIVSMLKSGYYPEHIIIEKEHLTPYSYSQNSCYLSGMNKHC